MSTTEETQEDLLHRAQTFSWSKIAVVEGEPLTDKDIFDILVKEFGDDPCVWLALSRNKSIRRVVSVHRVVVRRCLDLHVKLQALADDAPPPKAELEAVLKTLVA